MAFDAGHKMLSEEKNSADLFIHWEAAMTATFLGTRLRRDQAFKRNAATPLPLRQKLIMEPLENRLLLSAEFFAAPAVAPLVNHVDVAQDLNLGRFDEPNLTINNRDDTGNILITSHAVASVSTDMFINANIGNFPVNNNGDTWADFDTTGRAWWTNIDAATGGIRVVEVNPTTGQPIGNGVIVNTPGAGQSDDRQALAVDSFPDSPFHDNIYVIWTRFGNFGGGDGTHVFVARSADHGVTWTSTDIGVAGFDQQTHIAVGSNGDVWAAYHVQPTFVAGQTFVPDGTTGQVRLFRSTDGGTTWTETATQPFTGGQADITFNRQEAGNTGMIAGTDFLTQGSVMPYVVPDPVRPGQVYVVVADDTDNNHGNGDDSDLYIARSDNDGATWTRTLLPTGGGTSFQLFPTAVVDQFGTLVVTWYDNRRGLVNDGPDNIAGNADDNFLLDWMGMYSVDGGINWSAPFQINDVAFDPDEAPITNFQGGPTTRIGEYYGLDVFGGTAYVAFNGNTPAANTSQLVLFDAFAIAGSLVVTGDDNGPANDAFVMRRMAGNADYVEVSVNGVRQYVGLFESLSQVTFNGLAGNDTLTVDSTNGLLTFVNGIHYDGGTGFNSLTLSGGAMQTSDIYSVGPDPGEGTSLITGPGGSQAIFFQNLAPVFDLVPTASLTINATATDNAINYSAGSVATRGLVTIDEQEFIEFSNKGTLTINAGAGQDTISLNNASTPTSLTGITINGGNPNSGDTLSVAGVGAPVTVNTAASTISGATVPISYDGIENLNLLSGIGDLTITTTGADDIVTVTPGLSAGGANSGTVQSSGAVPQIAFVNGGTFTANLGAGSDALVVNGSSLADTIAVSGAAVAITGRRTVNFTGAEALTVNGNAGSDTFNVTPSAVATFIDGGDPIGALPGDLLNVLAGGATVAFNSGPEIDEGSFVAGANQPISFDHIESFGITGGGAVINGTNGPDAITVIARDASTHAPADGVQDFTVSVNTGPEVLFIDVPTVIVNALSGSDQVTLQTPAPNNMVWDVDVTVDGGAPAADTDRLIVQTPGTGPDTAVYTPTAFDAGTLDLTSLSSPVTITTTEALIYDGQGDNDSLTIAGTPDPDTIIHTPGVNDQAGSFQVNSLLGLSYQNLGSTGSLTADGGGGIDTLVYNGTAGNDLFTVGAGGQINLNSRVVLNTASIETLTLEGGNGDDTFTLVPAISSSVFTTMNFNGGGQASATGDRVNLIGTALTDAIDISGQAVTLGGKTVRSSGVEDIQLNALGGDDAITYNGVSGVTENIVVSSSAVLGGGQISVPNVALINFKDVTYINVNGNPPSPTETDTLTFAGTNAADTFQINLSAVGTDTDPILKLQNSLGATFLTLRSYTFFDTLRVLGLDGTDTFNVTTAATGPNRNLFVDGGLPSGKKKSTDNLNIFYTPPRPSIIHSAATQDPDAGIVDLDYGTARYVVQYDDIEQVVIRRK